MKSSYRQSDILNYYTDEDYDQVTKALPDLINNAKINAEEILEPTIHEKREVMEIIKNFIKEKKRKIYGGYAMNELFKHVDPKDAIYDGRTFADIEFYSPTPVPDLVEICNILYYKKFKFVQGKEAQHLETYTVTANIQKYCDISYVPKRVYNGIETVVIDQMHYASPHFILIDQLRMFNNPINDAWRWDKAFKRVFTILKDYPFKLVNQKLQMPSPTKKIGQIITSIINKFMRKKENSDYCIISGFEAYNFYVNHALYDRNTDQMSRESFINPKKLGDLTTPVPYLDLVSIDYKRTVKDIFSFLKENVEDSSLITKEEYTPLFQFTGYSIVFYYQKERVVRIYDADGLCLPNVATNKGYMYVSFQYLLMSLLIEKFRSFLEKDREMRSNYRILISNLIRARNFYLTKYQLGVINKSIFSEFKISCIGSTFDNNRLKILRMLERKKDKKVIHFEYTPATFFEKSKEDQEKFIPSKYKFLNRSGNIIMKPKYYIFILENSEIFVKNDEEIKNIIESEHEDEEDS